MRRIAMAFARFVIYTVAAVLLLVLLAIAALETGWGKNEIRYLLVRQANEYLTAELEIGSLGGSLFRGLDLRDIRLSRAGRTIISVDEASLSYSIQELFEPGLLIRRIRLVHPTVMAAREQDGRWNLAALLLRQVRQNQRTGPGRPVHVMSIQIADGDLLFADPLTFGAVHVPSHFRRLNVDATFDYVPVNIDVHLASASWVGENDVTIERMAGTIVSGRDGWRFDDLAVRSSTSEFTLAGQVLRGTQPTALDLTVQARHFSFQEWSHIVPGLRNIAVQSGFSLHLKGPLAQLATDLNLQSDAGGVRGSFVLNTTVPGWHGAGQADVDQVNLARWFNRTDRPSDISGHAVFNLDLDLGHHFPRGSFAFDGPHAEYLGYEAESLRARGTLTATDALIEDATGLAYDSTFHITSGSIGIDAPYAYRLSGTDTSLDLRRLPATIPVPHVESVMAFDFDATGQFESPSITGNARFADSEFLGAAISQGARGAIDTSVSPVVYSGEGLIDRVDIGRFGVALDTAWMQEPRYAGTVAGRFHVSGAGSDPATLTLEGGGHLTRGDLFGGALLDADVTLSLANGSLRGTYDGALQTVDPAIAFIDPAFKASLTGSGRATFVVRDLLVRTTSMADYDVDWRMTIENSTIRGIALDRGAQTAHLVGTTVDVASLEASGPQLEGTGSGRLEFGDTGSSQFDYNITRGDLSLVQDLTERPIAGQIVTKGTISGPTSALHLVGDGSSSDLAVSGVKALTVVGQYDAIVPLNHPADGSGRMNARASLVELLGRQIAEASGTVAYNTGHVDVDVQLPSARVNGSVKLIAGGSALDLMGLQITTGKGSWRLLADSSAPLPRVAWPDGEISTTPLTFADTATGQQHLTIAGTMRQDGRGSLRVGASHVSLDALVAGNEVPARYGGTIDLDATITGTREAPVATGTIAITDGRVRRLPYDKLAGRVDYGDGLFRVDLRLDQSATAWLTANGTVPYSLFDTTLPERPIDLALETNSISLGLLEGLTNRVSNVTGDLQMKVKVVGTSRDPHLSGDVSLANTAFRLDATGGRYKNGRAMFQLAPEGITVSSLHLEDRSGHALNITGTLGTHELTVGDLQIDIDARRFEILNNETGKADVDAKLRIRGRAENPSIEGNITIQSGQLNIDEILAQTLFQPYTVQPAISPGVQTDEVIAAFNPWDRLHLDIVLHSPGTLRIAGQNVQFAQQGPLGLGSFDLRATGDLYLSKNPGQPFYVNGSFDSITGSYAFQGRRFDIDPSSSINFKGDLDPEIFVTVTRLISGVEARVTIAGTVDMPELRLASTPPLDSSDILSLIVFNAPTNELSATQQQELAQRAGTLAYGFVATPLVAALQRTLGLETLEVQPATGTSTGPRVTVGNEIVPGLVAEFTRQFGQEAYDAATLEYYISRILKIRATFSDANSLLALSPFLRLERAGIDLLVFFSF